MLVPYTTFHFIKPNIAFIFRYSDEMRITLNETDGDSFWGIEDFQFKLSTCGRSIRTFMKSPTGFVSNINGPLRAIRYNVFF